MEVTADEIGRYALTKPRVIEIAASYDSTQPDRLAQWIGDT
jgi:hypothetical protein